MVYPHKWSPISCRPSAGQQKHAGQGPTFYHWTTRMTCLGSLHESGMVRDWTDDLRLLVQYPTYCASVPHFASWTCNVWNYYVSIQWFDTLDCTTGRVSDLLSNTLSNYHQRFFGGEGAPTQPSV